MVTHALLGEQKSDAAHDRKQRFTSHNHRLRSRLLRFETLETRRLMAADVQFNLPVDILATLSPSVQAFGVNTLPATDVPGALPDASVLSAAAPWTGAASAAFHGPAVPPLHTPSLEAGVLGNFAQLWRGSYGAVTPVPPGSDDTTKTPEKPQASVNIDEEVLDAIVVNHAPMIGLVSQAPAVGDSASTG
jgi:hypothetical protein